MSSFCGSDNDENDYEIGFREGAAVAFGLMGMAETIREICLCPDCGSHYRQWREYWDKQTKRYEPYGVCHCQNDE